MVLVEYPVRRAHLTTVENLITCKFEVPKENPHYQNRNQQLFGKLLQQGPNADKRVSTILDANSWRNSKTYTTTMRPP
jgi:hypothetical protein